MQRTPLLLVVLAVFVALGVAATGGTAGAPGDDTGTSGVAPVGFEQTEVSPDDVLIEAAVDADGNATWEIQYRVRLATDEEEQAFTDLSTDVESNTTAYTDRFRERMAATAAAAERSTGRDMAVTNATVNAERRELPQSYGVLTYRFEWRNFAAVDGDRIVVGDAVDELFLDDGSSFIVSWPEEYQVVETTPAPTETRAESVVWRGPVDFTDGEPRVSLEPAGIASGVSVPLFGVLAVVVLVAIVAAGVARYKGRFGGGSTVLGRDDSADRNGSGTTGYSGDSDKPTASTASTASTDSAGSTASADADESSEPDGEADDVGESGETDDVAGASPVDEELLSNEEQVLRLIESNGGRMKQKQVVETLDWTAAKTSQVVTGLRDDGELDGFRLGRENVLSLSDYEATSGDGETTSGDGETTSGDGETTGNDTTDDDETTDDEGTSGDSPDSA